MANAVIQSYSEKCLSVYLDNVFMLLQMNSRYQQTKALQVTEDGRTRWIVSLLFQLKRFSDV